MQDTFNFLQMQAKKQRQSSTVEELCEKNGGYAGAQSPGPQQTICHQSFKRQKTIWADY